MTIILWASRVIRAGWGSSMGIASVRWTRTLIPLFNFPSTSSTSVYAPFHFIYFGDTSSVSICTHSLIWWEQWIWFASSWASRNTADMYLTVEACRGLHYRNNCSPPGRSVILHRYWYCRPIKIMIQPKRYTTTTQNGKEIPKLRHTITPFISLSRIIIYSSYSLPSSSS